MLTHSLIFGPFMVNNSIEIRTVNVTRYVTPLREGGSLPAIAEADDGFMYVLKFRGAGQGIKALIAELIGGEIARTLGLKIPEIVFANLDTAFGRTEPDEEIQDLLKASVGLNLAIHYLSGAITYDPVVTTLDAKLASQIVWLDGLLMNVDRTARNTNMLVWHKELWLIDHGASLYFHHNWQSWKEQAVKPFVQLKDHVLLPQATKLNEVDAEFKTILTEEKVRAIVALLPDEWLSTDEQEATIAERRQVYADFLITRIASSHIFVKEAQQHAGKISI
ncbi:MAG TPA: HipA family kinase [Niastella sp.]